MNLSQLVHNQSGPELQKPPSGLASSYYTAPGVTSKDGMASSLAANPYSNTSAKYGYTTNPQPPPSPPVEEPKCSLPSIHSLLELTDHSQRSESGSRPRARTVHSQPDSQYRQNRRLQSFEHGGLSSTALPPTPPLRPGSVDGAQSSASSPRSAASAPPHFLGPSARTDDLTHTKQPQATAQTQRRGLPSDALSYASTPSQQSTPSYCSPSNPSGVSSDLYHQRSLPQNFPPSVVPVSVTPSSGTNPWQHHHYISPSSQAAFPPSQDRYICQTCSKAFSRPSSLRIHSHSHTGEKPFKCPHHGCGKAFSVRSNMKRHERGCHSSSPTSL